MCACVHACVNVNKRKINTENIAQIYNAFLLYQIKQLTDNLPLQRHSQLSELTGRGR